MLLGYARVSTASGEQLSALANQLERLRGAGAERIIQDIESGLNPERSGYLELLDLIDRHRPTAGELTVLITRVDRLGRDAAATDAFLLTAAKRGVTVRALDGGTVEMATPNGFLLARISTSMAEVESRMLSLRVKRGYEESRRKRRPARVKAPWGYRIAVDGSCLEPDPGTWDVARRFLAVLRDQHWRMSTALEVFDEPTPLRSCTSVRGWLVNPVLRGGVGYFRTQDFRYGEVHWGQHEAMIDHAEFAVIERQLEANRKRWGRNRQAQVRLLSGLCRCRQCGVAQCYAAGRVHPALLCKNRLCPGRYRSLRESQIIPVLARALSSRAEALAQMTCQQEAPEAVMLKQRIAAAKALNDPAFAGVIAQLERDLEVMSAVSCVSSQEIAALADPQIWSLASSEELRALLLALVRVVWLSDQAVESVELLV